MLRSAPATTMPRSNAGTAASATFTVDTTAPSPDFSPADSGTLRDASANITLTFAEAIRKDANGTDFTTASELAAILTLKADNSSGNDITYSASIDNAKKVITIDPTNNLSDGAVYVAISDGYYDVAGNQGLMANATFTVDTSVEAPVFSPADGETETDNTTNITLTFAEAIKANASNTDFTDTSIDNILTLKRTNASGMNIGFDATINNAKTQITINPTSNLPEGAIYVAISNAYYNGDGNQGTMESADVHGGHQRGSAGVQSGRR